MFNKIKKLFTKSEPVRAAPKEKKPRKPRLPKVEAPPPVLTPKEIATAAGEPYVEVLKFDMDQKDIHTGNFTIDFNDKFVLNLIRAGYKKKDSDTDNDIIDRWFTEICRSIVLEQYEQAVADPVNRGADDVRPPAQERDLGDGRREIS